MGLSNSRGLNFFYTLFKLSQKSLRREFSFKYIMYGSQRTLAAFAVVQSPIPVWLYATP